MVSLAIGNDPTLSQQNPECFCCRLCRHYVLLMMISWLNNGRVYQQYNHCGHYGYFFACREVEQECTNDEINLRTLRREREGTEGIGLMEFIRFRFRMIITTDQVRDRKHRIHCIHRSIPEIFCGRGNHRCSLGK